MLHPRRATLNQLFLHLFFVSLGPVLFLGSGPLSKDHFVCGSLRDGSESVVFYVTINHSSCDFVDCCERISASQLH